MSRVDVEVDGEAVSQTNFSDPDDVVIAIHGGDTEVFKLAQWEHLVIKIGEDPTA